MSQRSELSPPHGFYDDDVATRRLLRGRPPRQALAWAEDALGGTVVATHALRGGVSSAMHELTVTLPGGSVRRVVLRRYVRPELNVEEPDLAAREARALHVAERVEVPTPRPIACDPTGTAAGTPAVLMSRVPGKVRWLEWWSGTTDSWLESLAAILPAVHAVPLLPGGAIPPFTPYLPESEEPPIWSHPPSMWTKAVELAVAGPPPQPSVFVHRDFHPGNVLWQRRRVTGLVDWQAASIGPAAVDVGHCRANLFRYGIDVADRFTGAWERLTGGTYHPWFDIATLVSFLDDARDEPLEQALAAAVAALD